jgi:hypothetical protein
MNGTTFKVGRITVAIGLVAFGAALLVDNLTGAQHYTSLVVKLWPLLLVGFGAEYLIRSILSSREGQDVRLRFDIGGAFLLVLVVMLSVGVVGFHTWITDPRISLGIGPSESRTLTKSASATGVKAMEAKIPVGALQVEPNVRSDEIRVEATYTVHTVLVNRDEVLRQLDQIQLNISAGETARVTADLPANLNDLSVRFIMYVPAGLQVKAETGAGTLEVQGYKGDLQLTSQVGRIDVRGASGSLSAASGSGYILVQGYTGALAARTNVGRIEVRDQNGPMQLESGTGQITVDSFQGGKLVAETQMGGIQASTRTTLDSDVLLKTQTGSITLNVPKESSMRATAQVRSGSVGVPPFMNRTQNGPSTTAQGTNSDGKYTVSLEANTGSVHLNLN